MTVKRPFVSLLGVVAVLLLAGCQPSPTNLETPEIVWETESSSPLEGDQWLEAAQASELGFRLAYNARDFTISQLTETWPESSVESFYEGYLDRFVRSGAKPVAFPDLPFGFP